MGWKIGEKQEERIGGVEAISAKIFRDPHQIARYYVYSQKRDDEQMTESWCARKFEDCSKNRLDE